MSSEIPIAVPSLPHSEVPSAKLYGTFRRITSRITRCVHLRELSCHESPIVILTGASLIVALTSNAPSLKRGLDTFPPFLKAFDVTPPSLKRTNTPNGAVSAHALIDYDLLFFSRCPNLTMVLYFLNVIAEKHTLSLFETTDGDEALGNYQSINPSSAPSD
jgi:hypothetical protein